MRSGAKKGVIITSAELKRILDSLEKRIEKVEKEMEHSKAKVYVVMLKGRILGVYSSKEYADTVGWLDGVSVAEFELDKPIEAKRFKRQRT